MEREILESVESSWLHTVLEEVNFSPEFQFSQGDLIRKLEHACYYNMGDLCYPAHLLVCDFIDRVNSIAIPN